MYAMHRCHAKNCQAMFWAPDSHGDQQDLGFSALNGGSHENVKMNGMKFITH